MLDLYIGALILSFVIGYIAYPFTVLFFKKETTIADAHLLKIKSIVQNELFRSEEKIRKIMEIIKS